MMKNKKKKLIKGIMLSTVLGLGWNVAGDISHAAGNEFSQIQIAEWEEYQEYNEGDIVTYNGTQYIAQDLSQCSDSDYEYADKPGQTGAWRPVHGGIIAEWEELKYYFEGDMVIHKGIQYEALENDYANAPDETSGIWGPMNGAIPEWSENKNYQAGSIIIYNGMPYEALGQVYGEQPDESEAWTLVDGAISDTDDLDTSTSGWSHI